MVRREYAIEWGGEQYERRVHLLGGCWGEQGRGFAVVADEVRKLADRTAQSTVLISEVVHGISRDTIEAIEVIGHISSMAERSEEHADVTGRVIDEIAAGSETVLVGVSDISNAIREQSVAGRDIAIQVEKIAQMAEENNVSMVKVDQSAKTLEHLSVALKGLINRFKV